LFIRADDEGLAGKIRAALREAMVGFRETEPGRFEAFSGSRSLSEACRRCGLWLSTAELEQCQAAIIVDAASDDDSPSWDKLAGFRDVLARWWATGLAEALTPDSLTFRYQPVVSLIEPDRCLGYEALLTLRTGHAALPPVPDRLLDAAARASLLIELDEASLEAGLRGARELPGAALVFLNCLAETLASEGLAERLARSAQEHGRRPEATVLEVNVSRAVRVDAIDLTRSLSSLRQAGFKVALDRVEAEPWTAELLGALRPDYLKLDRGLVGQVHVDPMRQARLSALLEACLACGAQPIAVGIEDDGEGAWLSTHGISWGQGFLFGVPEDPA